MSENTGSGNSRRRGQGGSRPRGRGGRESDRGQVDIPQGQSGTTNARGGASSRSRGSNRRPNTRTSQSSVTDDTNRIKLVKKVISDISPGDVIYAETPGLREMNEKIDWVYGSTNPGKHDQLVLANDEVNQELLTVLLTTVGKIGENDNEYDFWDRYDLSKPPYTEREWGKGLFNLAGVEPNVPRREDIKNYSQPKYMIEYDADTEFRYEGPLRHWANVAHAFRIKPSNEERGYAVRNGMKFSRDSVKKVILEVIEREYDEDVKAILSEHCKDKDSTSLEMYIKKKKTRRNKRESQSAAETAPSEEHASGRVPSATEGGHRKRTSWAKVAEEGHRVSQASEKPPSLPSRAKDRGSDKGPAFVQPSPTPSRTTSWAKVAKDAGAAKLVDVSGKTAEGTAPPSNNSSVSNPKAPQKRAESRTRPVKRAAQNEGSSEQAKLSAKSQTTDASHSSSKQNQSERKRQVGKAGQQSDGSQREAGAAKSWADIARS